MAIELLSEAELVWRLVLMFLAGRATRGAIGKGRRAHQAV